MDVERTLAGLGGTAEAKITCEQYLSLKSHFEEE
jgi:hypothetical protein